MDSYNIVVKAFSHSIYFHLFVSIVITQPRRKKKQTSVINTLICI